MKINKIALFTAIFAVIAIFAGCLKGSENMQDKNSYTQISQDKAKEMMDKGNVIILDVREQSEYDEGHIKGAVLLPVGTITEETTKSVIPEKSSTVLVYCRSGNRSKTAAKLLSDLGYTEVYEFGGINTWQYDTEK